MEIEICPFDESPAHRRVLPYDPVYREIFLLVQGYVQSKLTGVELVHIGSTAVPDLRGKPMLDVVAVTQHQNLRAEQKEFEKLGFHRRNVWIDRDDKPYVCGAVNHQSTTININVHICHRTDPVHRESLAFMEILNARPDLRRKYEQAKDRAHALDPVNPEIYNREKETVIKEIHEQTR